MNSSKGPGYDTLSAKLIKMVAPLLTEPLTDIINSSIINEAYPDTWKTASVCPAYKKEDRLDKKNYRPVSILNTFTKIFERFYLTKLTPIFDKIMSENLSAFRKTYSTQHVLLKLAEQWRSFLDDNKYVGAVLMDLCKAFDCLSHDLLIAKLSAYGLDKRALKLLYSYLSNGKQSVRIQEYQSLLKLIISGVPQRSSILFNLFINDLYHFINAENMHNFADHNTLTDQAESLIALVQKLQILGEQAIDWMKENRMIANPSKFHTILFSKDRVDTAGVPKKVKDQQIVNESKVELLSFTIDNRLSFEAYISDLCKKAALQLNVLKRLAKFLNFSQRKVLAQSFVLSNFNYCPLI